VGGRVVCQERGVVGEPGPGAGLQHLQGIGQGHFAEAVVVAIGLTVGGHVDEAIAGASVVARGAQQAVGERLTAVQEPAEGDLPGHGVLVEEQGDLQPPPRTAEIRSGRIQHARGRLRPFAARSGAHPGRLVRGQDGEFDPALGQRRQGPQVHRSLRQPQALGRAAEAPPEVGDTPAHLGHQVPGGCQGKDGVVVGLSHGVAVAQGRHAGPVGGDDPRVGLRCVALEPPRQGGSHIEGDALVVVDDADDPTAVVEDAGRGVGRIALGGHALVPVVCRRGGVLDLDHLQPRVLPGRLVEMAVDAEPGTHGL
jgi:hypothetical protein